MNRCSDCNSLLSKEEKVCMECGSSVLPLHASNFSLAGFLKICFLGSIVYLIASMFIENANSKLAFMICCGLMFASRSAEQTQLVRRR